MERWEDLVKVASTLGKPILEFLDMGAGFTHHVSWVVDGIRRTCSSRRSSTSGFRSPVVPFSQAAR
jgi:hypothetical protein